jgi:hypothetical protein
LSPLNCKFSGAAILRFVRVVRDNEIVSDTERFVKPWHDTPEALADNWVVPCECCGDPVRAGEECGEITAKAAGTERVVARKAWCGKDGCFDDLLSGFAGEQP